MKITLKGGPWDGKTLNITTDLPIKLVLPVWPIPDPGPPYERVTYDQSADRRTYTYREAE